MAVDRHIQDRLASGYETLILAYAAGTLDEAQDLIVSTHVAMSPFGLQFAHRCEALGGALLEYECEPVSMSKGSLESVLNKLDQPARTSEPQNCVTGNCFPEAIDLPKPLSDVIAVQSKPPKWNGLFSGMHAFDLDLDCKNSSARFLKVDPAVKTPHHTHKGTEITLVLDGAFTDETGTYARGDLIVTDESFDHTPIACPENGCICMVVSTAPIKLKGFASLLNPFLKK